MVDFPLFCRIASCSFIHLLLAPCQLLQFVAARLVLFDVVLLFRLLFGKRNWFELCPTIITILNAACAIHTMMPVDNAVQFGGAPSSSDQVQGPRMARKFVPWLYTFGRKHQAV